MKFLISAAVVLAASSTLALAGGPITVPADPVPVLVTRAAPTDWSGL